MDIVKVTDKNYPILVNWWNDHNMAPLPQTHIPPNGGYAVVDSSGEYIIAGFLYKTDSAWGIFTWIVANPGKPGAVRTIAFSILCDYMVKYAKEIGVKHLLTFAKDNLANRFKANGYKQMNTEMQELFKEVT